MHQAQLTLHLAELDGYHGKLVPTMLEMLRPRLARAWRTVAEGEADAVLVDLDSLRGRQLAGERAGAGLGARTLALGSDEAGGIEAAGIQARLLHKPLRLHALLAALCAIESGDALPAVVAPDAAPPPCTVAPRYRMPAWPDLDARSASPARLRILALLERSALDAAGVAERLNLHVATVQSEIEALLERGIVVIAHDAPARLRFPTGARPALPGVGLVAMLRQRFGL